MSWNQEAREVIRNAMGYFTFTLELDRHYKMMNKKRIIIRIRTDMRKARIRLDKECVGGEM